jgi:hypothetical protein
VRCTYMEVCHPSRDKWMVDASSQAWNLSSFRLVSNTIFSCHCLPLKTLH